MCLSRPALQDVGKAVSLLLDDEIFCSVGTASLVYMHRYVSMILTP